MSRISTTLIALLALFFADAPEAMAQQTAAADPALLKKGEYLARAGDCIACHTAREGKTFAGGLPMKSRSARFIRPISRPTRRPASAPGRPISSTR